MFRAVIQIHPLMRRPGGAKAMLEQVLSLLDDRSGRIGLVPGRAMRIERPRGLSAAPKMIGNVANGFTRQTQMLEELFVGCLKLMGKRYVPHRRGKPSRNAAPRQGCGEDQECQRARFGR